MGTVDHLHVNVALACNPNFVQTSQCATINIGVFCEYVKSGRNLASQPQLPFPALLKRFLLLP